MQRKRDYNAEYRKRKSQKIEGHKTLMQAWEKARAPSDSAVLPPRSILQGVALASPDSTESQVEDTEDPWELQRLHDAWLAKEFFSKKKKNYVYGPKECLDCGKLLGYRSMSKHRRCNCKSRADRGALGDDRPACGQWGAQARTHGSGKQPAHVGGG